MVPHQPTRAATVDHDHHRTTIPRISEVSSLSSVLEHAMYCGMSLGRMGLDFRALLPPLFDAAVLAVFRRVLAVSLDRSLAALTTHRWSTLTRERRPPAPQSAGEDGGEQGPPLSLMEHPPLAMFANGVLAAFNELRHCAALSLRAPVIATLQVCGRIWTVLRCVLSLHYHAVILIKSLTTRCWWSQYVDSTRFW